VLLGVVTALVLSGHVLVAHLGSLSRPAMPLCPSLSRAGGARVPTARGPERTAGGPRPSNCLVERVSRDLHRSDDLPGTSRHTRMS
jgi:hypothetical protein